MMEGKGLPALDVPPHKVPSRRRRRRMRILGGVLILALIALGVFRNPWLNGNFGIVEHARVYRSAQPSENLARLVETHQVSSILNLRGGSPSDSFYADEVQLTRQRGIDFYDFPISATRRPTRRELLMLLELFERCRYPLLIHCKSGSDRTGLASALYLMSRAGKPPGEALGAFSIYYGHVPLGGTARLHGPLVEYRRWLEGKGLSHTPARLRSWVERDYQSADAAIDYPPLPSGPRASFQRSASR